MAYQGVTLKGTTPDNGLTFLLKSDIKEEHVGLAVTQDTSAANTVKLAGDGDEVLGVLMNVEDRTAIAGVKTGGVQLVGGLELKAVEDHGLKVGDYVTGGGNGLVKKSATGTNGATAVQTACRVWEVKTDSVIVIKNS